MLGNVVMDENRLEGEFDATKEEKYARHDGKPHISAGSDGG